MIQQVFCTGCGADGRLPLSLTFGQVYERCGNCHHESTAKSGYHFCTTACFFKWARSLEGLPCASCHGTGNAFGFAENGVCRPCGGTKFITENQTAVVAADAV